VSGRASPLFDARKDTMVRMRTGKKIGRPSLGPRECFSWRAEEGFIAAVAAQGKSLGFTSLNDYLTHLAAQAVGHTPKREIQEGLSFADVA